MNIQAYRKMVSRRKEFRKKAFHSLVFRNLGSDSYSCLTESDKSSFQTELGNNSPDLGMYNFLPECSMSKAWDMYILILESGIHKLHPVLGMDNFLHWEMDIGKAIRTNLRFQELDSYIPA